MTTVETEKIRSIEADGIPTRFARGWHCLGLTKNFTDGKPHAINAFGQRLVVFQGEDGKINIIDAYCRHMGGDLADGTIKGNEVACPFHDWRWGGDGRCKSVPYAKRVPKLARTKAWIALDQDGLLSVWNDPEGNPPTEDDVIPPIDGATSDTWTKWLWYGTEMNVNCREIMDNNVDMAHFYYVHGTLPVFFKNIFEKNLSVQYLNNGPREDLPGPEGTPPLLGVRSVATYHGPAFMIDYLTYLYEGFEIRSVLLHTHYPIDGENTMYQYAVIVEQSEFVGADVADATAKGLGDWVKRGIDEDINIWRRKTRIDNPLLSEEDGAVYQLRRWYSQFYVDRADVTPEMVDRFEHEVDVSKALETWRDEIRENIRRAALTSS